MAEVTKQYTVKFNVSTVIFKVDFNTILRTAFEPTLENWASTRRINQDNGFSNFTLDCFFKADYEALIEILANVGDLYSVEHNGVTTLYTEETK